MKTDTVLYLAICVLSDHFCVGYIYINNLQ